MAKYIHNVSGATLYFLGVEVGSDQSHLIPKSKEHDFAGNNGVIEHIALGNAKMSADGLTFIAGGPAEQLKFLIGESLVRTTAFADDEGVAFNGVGFTRTATAGTTGDLDWQIPLNLRLTGLNIFADGHARGDNVTFQVVDKDNILGLGVNTVLSTFATDWYIDWTMASNSVHLPYCAVLLQNLYVRIKYTSVGVNNVSLYCNLFCHKDTE